MDPLLRMALVTIRENAASALQNARTGEEKAAALEFAQASMALGLQIGHFRAVLGQRYPTSAEAATLNQEAIRLSTTISLAFTRVAAVLVEEEPDDHQVECETDGDLYGFEGNG